MHQDFQREEKVSECACGQAVRRSKSQHWDATTLSAAVGAQERATAKKWLDSPPRAALPSPQRFLAASLHGR
eukprot:39267-Pyramimonas_sp.AAC.1